MRKLLPFLLLLPQLAFGAGSRWPVTDLPRFWVLSEGTTHIAADNTYFQTQENYDLNGGAATLANLSAVHYDNLRLQVGHGFAPRVSIFAQADGRQVFVSNKVATSSGSTSNMSIGDLMVGLRWLVYRSRSSDRLSPSEWAPNSFVAVAEGTWVFPSYSRTSGGRPPVGDQSNDFSGVGRVAWYANDWLTLSGSAGYTYRTAGYSQNAPWNLRADFTVTDDRRLRLWAGAEGIEGLNKPNVYLNRKAEDFFVNGSLLFKSFSPTERTANIGLGHLIGKDWEVAGAIFTTVSGVAAAKGSGVTLGFTWRPYQSPELQYESYRRQQIERKRTERTSYATRKVISYGLSAVIVKVSAQKKYFKITYGSGQGVKVGDAFEVFPPDDLSGKERKAIAAARVAAVKDNESFLRVEQKLNQSSEDVEAGHEARRVTLSE